MKYLLIFLPIFCFAQGVDSTLYGMRLDTIPDYIRLPEGRSSSMDMEYPDGTLKVKGDSVFRWAKKPKWTICNQQFGEVDHPNRDKIEQSEVNILVWTGCSLAEYKATKFIGYNYSDNSFYVDDTVRLKDVIIWYLAGGKWIKNSHVIKEL